MTVAKSIKVGVMSRARDFGLFAAVSKSKYRARRLLILGYHGIAEGPHHQWCPHMFLPPSIFARHMEILHESGCSVLPLADALRRLEAGTLPPRSVALTFDDGWADFRVNALPLLHKYGYPATVYLTTYNCLLNAPVLRLAFRYMVWQSRGKVIEQHKLPFVQGPIDCRTSENRTTIVERIWNHVTEQKMDGQEMQGLAAEIASSIGFDYAALSRERILNLMNPEEIANISRLGVDVQLHSHSHNSPNERSEFICEIERNRRVIEELTGGSGRVHFCYPSGVHHPRYLPWLREAGVKSATTCEGGLAARDGEPLRLPRLLDQWDISDLQFEAWVTGFAAVLPRRRVVPHARSVA